MKKTFDAPVDPLSVSRSSRYSDIEFMEAQNRSLENEIRNLRESLRDRFAMAALTGIIAGYSPVEWLSESESDLQFILQGAAKGAFALADEMLIVRKV